MIACGYCESQNQNNNQCCIACGGSLVDEISQKEQEQEKNDLRLYFIRNFEELKSKWSNYTEIEKTYALDFWSDLLL